MKFVNFDNDPLWIWPSQLTMAGEKVKGNHSQVKQRTNPLLHYHSIQRCPAWIQPNPSLSLSLSLSFCISPKVTHLSLRNPHGVSPQKAVFRIGQHNGGVPVVLWFWVERLRFLSIVMLFRLSFGLPLLHFYSLSPKKSWKALPLLGHLSLRARHHFLCCLPLCFLQEVLFTAAPF